MNSQPIDHLSAIKQSKHFEESQQTFEESRPIVYPHRSRNYECMICTRLRSVCPYTKLTRCPHEGRERATYQSQYFTSKSNISLGGERTRIFSQQEVVKQTQQSRQTHLNIVPAVTQTQVNISPIQQVIYYPVIHNRLVLSPSLEQSRNIATPNRQKRSRRVDYGEDIILTPTQVKQLIYSRQ